MSDFYQDLMLLVLGGGGILVTATLVGRVLKRRLSPDGRNVAVENLVARVNAWWAMVVLMAIAFIFGRAGVIILFAFCSFAALREFATLTTKRRGDYWPLLIAFFVVLPVQYWLVWMGLIGIQTVFIPVYVFLLMPIVAAFSGDTSNFLERVAETQWALMICVFCASHVPALLLLEIPGYEGRSVLLIAWLIIVVQLSDVLQYVWGKLLGRTPVAPKLSPSKTVEGLVGGVASATLIGGALFWITPFTLAQALVMALMITLLGFCGGLVMSAIKRDRGVKDWGQMIAGHGGFLDRLDSVVFAAPIFFHVTRYFWSTT